MNSTHWTTSPAILTAVAVALVLQFAIARKLPEGMRVLKVHAGFALFGILLTAIGHWLPSVGADDLEIMTALVKAGWGVLFIRIICIYFFRVLLPSLGVTQPRIVHEIIFVIACITWGMVRLRAAGVELGSIVTTSAAITAILAFSMQETLGNILGGVALQADHSIHIGDWISVDNVRGRITEIGWRHTAIVTADGEVIVIPNSMLMKMRVTVITSEEYPIARRTVKFSVMNTSPPQEVVAVVEKALRDATLKHVSPMPPPDCVLADYEGGNMNFEVRYWLQDQLHDAAADSNVLMHAYAALRRNEFILARPLLDMRLAQPAAPREAEPDEQEIERRCAILSHVMLFFNLTDDERRKVAARLRVTPFMRDDVITRQGSVAHWLYVLVEGEADVWYETRNGQRRLVTSLGAGAVFGEMGLMTGAPRAATVAARCDSVCFRIDKESFEDILRARPALADEIARIISERHTELDAVRGEDHAEVADRDADSLLGKIRRFFHLELSNTSGK